MHTQCPKCKKKYTFSAERLAHFKKGVFCKKCHYKFDSFDLLDKASSSKKQDKNGFFSSRSKSSKPGSGLWVVGSSVFLALFAFQVYFFEGYNLTQNAVLRPWLKKICHLAQCQLATYKNLKEFNLLPGAFEATGNNFVFKTNLTNQSTYIQATPSIKLILLDYTGAAFAERIFHPENYVSSNPDFIKPNTSIDITIDIAAPTTKIGGYRFELI